MFVVRPKEESSERIFNQVNKSYESSWKIVGWTIVGTRARG